MEQINISRIIAGREEEKTRDLYEKVMKTISQEKRCEYEGNVDEVIRNMDKFSVIFMLTDEHEELLGVVVLRNLKDETEELYTTYFPEIDEYGKQHKRYCTKERSLIADGLVLKNTDRSFVLLVLYECARNYAFTNGFNQFVGQIDWKDEETLKVLDLISIKKLKVEFIFHPNYQGELIPTQFFLCDLV